MRLLRFDRSGVVVTGKILFDEESLFDFFHRFTSATPAERGRDSTVTAANLSCQTEEIRRLLNCDEKAPLLTISIDHKEYIILKDQDPGSTSPIGRSTRCFKAYCLETKRLVLLKDSWRVVSPNLQPEHEIYEKLHKAKVQNIPAVYHGSDIANENDVHHTTQTKLWYEKADQTIKRTFRTHRHYRIVLEYLPFKLEEFEITREMIAVVRDASIAHRDAAIEAKVAHRDISNGNIMFKRKPDGNVQGYLIDWDLSLNLELADENSVEAQPERTGTWQFLAIRLFDTTNKEPVIQNRIDDVESFYHLILWMALRYTDHTLDSLKLTTQLHDNFDASYWDSDGRPLIGNARKPNIKSGDLIAEAKFGHDGIKTTLQRMHYASEHGEHTAEENERKEAEVKKASGLKTLDDPQWLSDLLTSCLQDEELDWDTNSARVKHALAKFSKFVSIQGKRKTESIMHSEGPRKASRKSGQSTPQDNRSGLS
ncbi:hypothetical protein C0993_007143 [Termitomyces sp. T159_Od127]|nr:hypothetical protein C0993_007143 [Termitomyces sp. T159_Od127]